MADNKSNSFLTSTFENIANLNTAKVQEEQNQVQAMQRDFGLLKDALVFSIDQPLENIARTLEIAGYKNPAAFLQNLVDKPQDYQSAVEDFLNMQDDKSYNFNYDYMPRAVVEQFGQIAGSLALRGIGQSVPVAGPVLGIALPTAFQAAQTVGPIALERANNNGRAEPNWDDWRQAGGASLASGLIDTYGVFGIGKLNSTIFGAAVREGLTEGTQSLIEQAGGTAFTEKGLKVDPEQAVGETLIGSGSGAAVQTPFSISKAILKADLDKEKAVDADFAEVKPNVLADNSLPPKPFTPFGLLEQRPIEPRREFDEQFSLLGAGQLNLEGRKEEADVDFDQAIKKRLETARQYLDPNLSYQRYVSLLDGQGIHLGSYSKEEYLALLDKINLEITEKYNEEAVVTPSEFAREADAIASRFTEVQLRDDVYKTLKEDINELKAFYTPAQIKYLADVEGVVDRFSETEFEEISARLNSLIDNLSEETVQYLKTHLQEYQNEVSISKETTSAANQPEVKANVIRQYFNGTPELKGSINAEVNKIFREKITQNSEQPLTDTRFKGTGDAFTTEERALVTTPELENRKTNVEQTLSNIIEDIVSDSIPATSNQFKNPETDVFSTLGPRLDILNQLDSKPNYTPSEIKAALSSRLDVFTDEYTQRSRNYIDSVPKKQKGNTINILEAERQQAQDELNQTGIGKLIQLRQSENSLIGLNELYKMIDDFNRRFDYVETNLGTNQNVNTYGEVVSTGYVRANFNNPELLAKLNEIDIASLDDRAIKELYLDYGVNYPLRESMSINGPVLGMSQTGFRFKKMTSPDIEEQLQEIEEVYKDDVNRLRKERQKILEENDLEFNDYEAGSAHPQSIYWTRNQFRKIFDVNTPLENLTDANTAIGIGKGIIEGQSDVAKRAKKELEAAGIEDQTLDGLEETENALETLTGDRTKQTALNNITNFEIKLRDNNLNILNNVAPKEYRLVLDEYIKATEKRVNKQAGRSSILGGSDRKKINILEGTTGQSALYRDGIIGSLRNPTLGRFISSEAGQRAAAERAAINKAFTVAHRFKIPYLSAFIFSLLEGDNQILINPGHSNYYEYVPFKLPGSIHRGESVSKIPSVFGFQKYTSLDNLLDPESKILEKLVLPAYRKTVLDNIDWFAERFANKEQNRINYFKQQLEPSYGATRRPFADFSSGNPYVEANRDKIRDILQREIDRGPRTKEEIAKQLKAAIKKNLKNYSDADKSINVGPVQVFSPAALEEIGEAFMLDPSKANAMNYESFDRFNFRPRRPQEDAEVDLTDSSDRADFVKELRRALEDHAKGKRYFNLSLPRFMPKSMPQELKDKDPRYLRDETLREFLDFYTQNDQLLKDFMLAFVFDKHAMEDPDNYKRYYDLETERSKYEAVFETEKLFREFNDKFFRDKTMEIYQKELKKVLPRVSYEYFDKNKGIMEEGKRMLALNSLVDTLESPTTISKYKEMPLSKSSQVARDAVRKEIKKLLTDPNERLATHFFIPYKLTNVINGQQSTVGSYELMQKELRALHKRIAEKYPELNLPEPFDVLLNVGSDGIFATAGTKDQIEDRIEDQKGKKETFDKADKALALDIRQLRELYAQDPTILQVRGYKKGGLVV
jgi:hypothetical protein